MQQKPLQGGSGDGATWQAAALNQQDLLANLIFFLGVLIALQAIDIDKQVIEQQPPEQEAALSEQEIARLLAMANWSFLAAAILLLDTALDRLEDDRADTRQAPPSAPIEKKLQGRELVVTGDSFKVIGFLLAALGNEMLAESAEPPEA